MFSTFLVEVPFAYFCFVVKLVESNVDNVLKPLPQPSSQHHSTSFKKNRTDVETNVYGSRLSGPSPELRLWTGCVLSNSLQYFTVFTPTFISERLVHTFHPEMIEWRSVSRPCCLSELIAWTVSSWVSKLPKSSVIILSFRYYSPQSSRSVRSYDRNKIKYLKLFPCGKWDDFGAQEFPNRCFFLPETPYENSRKMNPV